MHFPSLVPGLLLLSHKSWGEIGNEAGGSLGMSLQFPAIMTRHLV